MALLPPPFNTVWYRWAAAEDEDDDPALDALLLPLLPLPLTSPVFFSRSTRRLRLLEVPVAPPTPYRPLLLP